MHDRPELPGSIEESNAGGGRAAATDTYIIRGGVEGFDRMKVVSRVAHASTCALFDRVGIRAGMKCLDVGCGTGDVTFELARRVGASGVVVGVDLDEVKLDLARREASELRNVELRRTDVTAMSGAPEYDLVYARLLLTHTTDPGDTLAKLRRLLLPGGMIVVEDIDLSGSFCHPPSAAHARYLELYTETARRKGVDPNIGPRLPELLASAGLTRVQVGVVQPMGLVGEVKLLPALTMKAITDSVVAQNLAREEDVERIVADLFAMAEDPRTLMGAPRLVQAWGWTD